jgi:hypothetical protein
MISKVAIGCGTLYYITHRVRDLLLKYLSRQECKGLGQEARQIDIRGFAHLGLAENRA